MRILVVEDELDIADALRHGLEAEGYAIDVASNGDDALWLARERDYATIVLDLMLPGVNGFKVCQTPREEGNWTPIIVLTAKNGEYDEAERSTTGRTTSCASRSARSSWPPDSGRWCVAGRGPGPRCCASTASKWTRPRGSVAATAKRSS